ncbi:MAG: hypothetical protein LBJ46_09260 [Planctomycetota bacterium]|jgi:hypothetical protein|nr:hypothetical protein [Planctomycetota bacterium]
MKDNDQRRQEIMKELAERFKSSSEVMKLIAKRIGEAANCHSANRRRLEQASTPLRKSIDPKSSGLPFSYREFIEFASAEEFQRFRDQEPITSRDIEEVDWEELSRGLLG